MVLVCLPPDALSQPLLSYLGFSYLGRGVSLHSCSSKAQPLLLILDEGYLLTAAPPDLERGVAPLGPPANVQPTLFGRGGCSSRLLPRPRVWGSSSWQPPLTLGEGWLLSAAIVHVRRSRRSSAENSERDGIPDHLPCLLRNLYAGQEATARTGHGTTDWFQIGKGVRQGCILSPCLFNLHAEYIMRNAGLGEAQAGMKTARRNINNLRYADDTTCITENEEELKSLLMKVRGE